METKGVQFASWGSMGKDQELIEAARNGDFNIVQKILNSRAKKGTFSRLVQTYNPAFKTPIPPNAKRKKRLRAGFLVPLFTQFLNVVNSSLSLFN